MTIDREHIFGEEIHLPHDVVIEVLEELVLDFDQNRLPQGFFDSQIEF